MPSISHGKVESIRGEAAYTLDLRPPITDRLAELLCRHTVDPFMMVVRNDEDATRIRVESDPASPHDIKAIAESLGKKAFPGQEVQIINAAAK